MASKKPAPKPSKEMPMKGPMPKKMPPGKGKC